MAWAGCLGLLPDPFLQCTTAEAKVHSQHLRLLWCKPNASWCALLSPATKLDRLKLTDSAAMWKPHARPPGRDMATVAQMYVLTCLHSARLARPVDRLSPLCRQRTFTMCITIVRQLWFGSLQVAESACKASLCRDAVAMLLCCYLALCIQSVMCFRHSRHNS